MAKVKKLTLKDLPDLQPINEKREVIGKDKIKILQKMVEDIGLRKREGVVYILSSRDRDDSGRVQVGDSMAGRGEGVLFTHEMNLRSVLANFLMTANFSPIKVLSIIEQVEEMRKTAGWDKN